MKTIVACRLLTASHFAADPQATREDGFVSLFNGKDLTGWEYGPVPVSKKPIREKPDGKTATKDGVFEVRDGSIVAGGKRVAALYTAQPFNSDFQLRLEFRCRTNKPKDNSGIYIRGHSFNWMP